MAKRAPTAVPAAALGVLVALGVAVVLTVAVLSSEVGVVAVVAAVELVQADEVLFAAELVAAAEEGEDEPVLVTEPEWEPPATMLLLPEEPEDPEDDEDEKDEDEAPAVTVTVACAVEVSCLQMFLARFSALVKSAALHWAFRHSPARACSWACFSLRQRQSTSVMEQPVSGMAL